MTHTATAEAETSTTEAGRADAVEKMLDAVGETAARETLTAAGNRAGLQLLERIVARRLAADMLADQQPRQAIRERLIARGLSIRTAYRLLDAAAAMVGLKPAAAVPPPSVPATVNLEPLAMITDTATEPTAADSTTEAAAPAAIQTPPLDAANVAPEAAATPTPPAGSVKVKVLHLKAPWPQGTTVGSIVEMPGDIQPGWTLGKCQRVPDETAAHFTWVPPAPPARTQPLALPAAGTKLGADPAAMGVQLAEARQAHDKALVKLAAARKRLADAETTLQGLQPTGGTAHPGAAGLMGALTGAWKLRKEIDAASIEAKAARTALHATEAEVRECTGQVEMLNRLASTQDRLQAAMAEQAGAHAAAAAAALAIDNCAATIKRLDDEIRAEEASLDQARRDAAATLLQRAQAGSSLDDVTTPNEGRLSALRHAKADAVDALAAARQQADATRKTVQGAVRGVHAVLADEAMFQFHRAWGLVIEHGGAWCAHSVLASNEMPALPEFREQVLKACDGAMLQIEQAQG